MKAISIVGMVVLFVPTMNQPGEKDTKALIVGFWKVVKSEEAPAGSSVQFTKEGKLILIPKGTEKKKVEAAYTIDGKKLTTTRKEDGKVEMNLLTIEMLNETTLITLNEKGKRDELKRVKGNN